MFRKSRRSKSPEKASQSSPDNKEIVKHALAFSPLLSKRRSAKPRNIKPFVIEQFLKGRKPRKSQANPDHCTCYARLALARFANGEKLFPNPKLILFQKQETHEELSFGIAKLPRKFKNFEKNQETKVEDEEINKSSSFIKREPSTSSLGRNRELTIIRKSSRSPSAKVRAPEEKKEEIIIEDDKFLDRDHVIIVPMEETERRKNISMFWNEDREKLRNDPPPYDEIGPPSYIQSLTHPTVEFLIRQDAVIVDNEEDKARSKVAHNKYEHMDSQKVKELLSRKREYIRSFTKLLNKFESQIETVTLAFGENLMLNEAEKNILEHYDDHQRRDFLLEKINKNLVKIEMERESFLKEVFFDRQNVDMRDHLAKYMKLGIKLVKRCNDVMMQEEENVD